MKDNYRKPVQFAAILFTILFLYFSAPVSGFCEEINMGFLNSRIKTVNVEDGNKLTVWETTDKELTEKGIMADTKEMSLVAMAYIRHYQIYDNSDSLKKALEAFRFLRYMQGKNGCFHKYLLQNGKIYGKDTEEECNLEEQTAYAFVALAEGIRAVRKAHPGECNQMEDSFLRVVNLIGEGINSTETGYGTYTKFQKMKIPAWLIRGRGDLSAMYLMGMSRFYEDNEYYKLGKIAKELGQGVMEFKFLEPENFPQHAHLTFTDLPTIWKTNNAFQTAALAYGSKAFQRKVWLSEARDEGVGFLLHLVTSYGPIEGFYPHPDLYPQSAVGAWTLTTNFIALYRVTKNEDFAKIAGLCAAWFFKNNPTGNNLYFAADGSCTDKVFEGGVNEKKSLKGSAVAILSLLEVHGTPGEKYLNYKSDYIHGFLVIESEEGKPVNTDFEIQDHEYTHEGKGKVVVIRRNNTFWHKFKVDYQDNYFLLLSYQKQLQYSSAVAVNVRIDGGPILLVPLGGAVETPYMLMQKVTESVPLLPGLHTLGVRYKGLLLTLPAIIDCSVIQPVLQRKKFSNEFGQHLILIKNWEAKKHKMKLSEDLKGIKPKVRTESISGKELKNPITTEKGKTYFNIPEEGYGIMEW